MAILFIDSFDSYVTADLGMKWTGVANQAIVQGVGRCGTAAVDIGSVSVLLSKTPTNPAPTGSTVIVGCARQQNSGVGSTQGTIIEVGNGSGATVRLVQLFDGTLVVETIPSPPIVIAGPTASFAIQTGIYYYIEFKVLLSATVGTVDVRINGVSVLSATGLNTIDTQSTAWTYVAFRNVSGSPNATYYDDIYIADASGGAPHNDFLGDVHVSMVLPLTDAVAPGFYQDWSLSAGTDHGALVRENPPDGDVTYVFTGTPGLRESFRFPSIKLISGIVFAIQTNIIARKDLAGTRVIRPLVRSGGTTVEDIDRAVSVDTYFDYVTIYPENPVGPVPWTVANVNLIEVGAKLQS